MSKRVSNLRLTVIFAVDDRLFDGVSLMLTIAFTSIAPCVSLTLILGRKNLRKNSRPSTLATAEARTGGIAQHGPDIL